MPKNYHFRNVVFEGGGVKGIAHVGALREFEKWQILQNIDRIGGTSAGAINAVLLSTSRTLKETSDIFFSLNFPYFLDDSWGVVRDTKRLITEFR